MKFGELLEYEKKEMFFFKNQTENEAVRLVPDLVFLKKHYIRLKKVMHLDFNIFLWTLI